MRRRRRACAPPTSSSISFSARSHAPALRSRCCPRNTSCSNICCVMPAASSPAACCLSRCGAFTSTRRPAWSRVTSVGCAPSLARGHQPNTSAPSVARDICSLFGLRRFINESSQLAALLIALFAGSALLLGATAYWIADRAMRAELHDVIDADVGAVLNGYRSEGRAEAIEVVQQLSAVPGVSGRYLLQSAEGQKLAGSLAPMTAKAGLFVVRASDAHQLSSPQRRREHREVVLGEGRFLPDGSYLFVGEDTERLAATRGRILASFAWIIGVTGLLAIVSGAVLSAGFLRRIDAITRTCRAVVAGRFGDRIPVRGSQTQLDRLSATINEMLDRIATLMESLRQMSSDIAHDLRTPLTRLRQGLESVRGEGVGADEYETVIERAHQ